MKLLLDLGNSRFKWALLDGDVISDMQVSDYKHHALSDTVSALLQTLPLNQVDEIHSVSVLSKAFNAELNNSLKQLPNKSVYFYFSHKEKFGVSLAYETPADYGPDRYAGLIAAHHMYQGDKIIIECGTAVTIDAIDVRGKHMGGLILPGEHMMRDSLVENTQRVFYQDSVKDPAYLNASTPDAVLAGAALGLRHGVWGIVNEIRQKLNQHIVVITGGNAQRLYHPDYEPYHKCPALVLEGLKIMVNF